TSGESMLKSIKTGLAGRRGRRRSQGRFALFWTASGNPGRIGYLLPIPLGDSMPRTVFHSLLLALCTAAVAQAAAVDRPFSLTPEAAVKALAAAAPAIDETALFQGGQTLALRGLFASDAVATNLALVNRSQATN